MENNHQIITGTIRDANDYRHFFGMEEGRGDVGVVYLGTCPSWPQQFRLTFECYALLLINSKCGDIRYGYSQYDFDAGTIVAYAPGQVIEVMLAPDHRPDNDVLLLRPDFLAGTPLGEHFDRYSFFGYDVREALHVSEEEKSSFKTFLAAIDKEIASPQDRLKEQLIAMQVELLLNYCLRFYERQFSSRKAQGEEILSRIDGLLDDYFRLGKATLHGLPTVKYLSSEVHLSPNYFGDMVKYATGKSVRDIIADKVMQEARKALADTHRPIADIAYDLGFQTSQHFATFFKRHTGTTPAGYRKNAKNP